MKESLMLKNAHLHGATTLTRKRLLEGDAYRDLLGFDSLLERFTDDEWVYIDKHYPNARQNIVLFRDEAAHRLKRLEK